MSTALDIVRRSLRAIGVLAAGKQPTGSDPADALERLQSVILGLPGLLHNGRWREVATSASYTAKEGERISVTGAVTITLPSTITCVGATRPPLDLARVQILGASVTNAGLWVYSASKGSWGQADRLTISGELPFGAEDDAGLAALLAVDMASEYGDEAELGQRTIATAQAAARSFRARFKKTEPINWSRPEPCDPLEIRGCTFLDYR
jgi:hypothetical protein